MSKISIDMVGCLHGSYPSLAGGDLLIITGDLTARDKKHQYFMFFSWLAMQSYRKYVVIGGNHDTWLSKHSEFLSDEGKTICYLNNSATEFEGLKIWGTPHSLWFSEVNLDCKAFMANDYALEKIYEKIPNDIDIFVSHGPMKYILDENKEGTACGSYSLRSTVERIKPKLFVSSHIHEGYGSLTLKHQGPNTLCVNCSHMDADYKPINKPIRVIYDKNTGFCSMDETNKTD